MLTISDLEKYSANCETGFVPATDPLLRLPDYYEPWENIISQVEDLLMSEQMREFVDRLPHLSLDHLDSERARQRAMLLLSIMGNAYVWSKDELPAVLPAQIAVPWCELANYLGRPPIAAHESMVLNNWRRIDPDKPVSLDNVATLAHFLGGMDEQWFYLVTLQIELDGAPALPAMITAQNAIDGDQPDIVTIQLQIIAEAIHKMLASLQRMYEKCDPLIFYTRIRRYVSGWPEPGLVYEGISPEPIMLIGGSAAQSALVQALDVGLGVDHPSPKSGPFLMKMREYMPRAHREFLTALGDGPAIRPFVARHAKAHPQLAAAYDACLNNLADFRKKHIEISVRYIVHQAPEQEEAKGTGGTDFVPFLSEARKETTRQRLLED